MLKRFKMKTFKQLIKLASQPLKSLKDSIETTCCQGIIVIKNS